jgi:DNA excision repair protein ERCC-4
MIKITVDDRERNDHLLTALQQAATEISIKRLAVGDYLLDNLIVERKSFADFSASITDGRLFRQASYLAAASEQPLLIVEGADEDWGKTGISLEALNGALISVVLIFKIPVLFSSSPEETAKMILFAASQLNRSSYLNNLYPRPNNGRKKSTKKQKIQSHVLQGIPGIGPARAKELINKFGTLVAIFNSSDKQLETISGMGKKGIKRWMDWTH